MPSSPLPLGRFPGSRALSALRRSLSARRDRIRRPTTGHLARDLGRGLCALLWPAACCACGCPTEPPGLCPDCAAGLVARPSPRCMICDDRLPARGPAHRCGRCLERRPRYARAWGLFDYAGPAGDLIRAAKYGGQPAVLDALSRAMLGHWPPGLDGEPPSLVIPVPLHLRRVARRGHAPPLRLAAGIARPLGLPLGRRHLRRLRDTPEQAGLDDAGRRRNMRGAFAARRVAGHDVLLVDDAMTTGATVDAAAHALLGAGAHRVRVLCAARVERDAGR